MSEPTRDEAQALYAQMTVVDLQAELGERNLAKSGTKDELVGRLLDADFPPAPNPDPAPPADAPPAEGELCCECWPGGWPGNDVAATCSHGQWTR